MKSKIPSIPIPDFEKRLITEDEKKQIEFETVKADPETGISMTSISYTYADIAKRFNVESPSEQYRPTLEEIAAFSKVNPFVTVKSNGTYDEVNPYEKELKELPAVETLFHNLNQSILRDS